MSLSIPSIATIRGEILTAWFNLDPAVSVSRYSDAWIRAHTAALAIWGVYAKVDEAALNIFPDTASSAYLQKHYELYGLEKLAPTTSASPAVRLTGTPGAVVLPGIDLVHADGTEYVTISSGVIPGGGYLDVAVVSASTGSATNKEAAEVLTVVSPPAGIDNTATVQTAFSGGTDEESDAEILARLLRHLRSPPSGGTKGDYESWALSIDGVESVFVQAPWPRPGYVDVIIMTDSGTRATTKEAEVTAYIGAVRPLTALGVTVRNPTAQALGITADIYHDGERVWSEIEADIEAAISAYLYSLNPGDTAYRSALIAAMMAVEGVVNVDMSLPAADVTTTVDEVSAYVHTAGSHSLTEMP